MSMARYRRRQGAQGGFGPALQAWRRQYAAARAAAAAAGDDWQDDPFADVRDRSPDGGRPPLAWLAAMSEGEPASKPESELESNRKSNASTKPTARQPRARRGSHRQRR